MIEIVHRCEKCGDIIPTEKYTDLLGIERERVLSGKVHPFCNDIIADCIEVCKTCAVEIDSALLEFKLQIVNEINQNKWRRK